MMRMRLVFAFIALLIGYGVSVVAKEVPFYELEPKESAALNEDLPWLTGPLLSPSANVYPPGSVNFEPYIYVTAFNGFYDSHWHKNKRETLWSINFDAYYQMGITNWLGFSISPNWTSNYIEHASSLGLFGDLPVALQIQIFRETRESYAPSIRLSFQESFPLGKYTQLNPAKRGTDISGSGSYVTGVQLVFGRLFHLTGVHWLNITVAYTHNVPSRVHVKGYNAYGGAPDTNGWVYLPQSDEIDVGLQATFSRRWAFACDIVSVYRRSTRFKGNPGRSPLGLPAMGSVGSGTHYSLAPALEYNWNENLGIISGAWFTLAGRNTGAFASSVTAFNYSY